MTLSDELIDKITSEKKILLEKKAKSWAVILDLTKRQLLDHKALSGIQEIVACDNISQHITNIHSIIHKIKLLEYISHNVTSYKPNKSTPIEFKVRKR